ncbi:MAG: hypothetical protein HYU02_01050 [Thaumarchaeota archaeon]|nr:hypothetical protein [Nitrososphaerota archaeon]
MGLLESLHIRKAKEAQGIVKPLPGISDEIPKITFSNLVDYYNKEPIIRLAASHYSQSIVGKGHYTSSESQRAKKVVDRFSDDIGLDNFLVDVATHLYAFGNCFTEKRDPDNLQDLANLPIGSDWRIQREDTGEVQKIIQIRGGRTVEFEPNEIIHWKVNVLNGEPIGRGVLHTLAETRSYTIRFSDKSSKTITIAPLIQQYWMHSDTMRKIARHYVPLSAWQIKGLKKEDQSSVQSTLRKLEPGERIALFDAEAEIKSEQADPRGRLEIFETHFQNQMIFACMSPLVKAFTREGFVGESALKIVDEWYQDFIDYGQRLIKNYVEEEIFRPIVQQNGMNWTRERVKFLWGVQEQVKLELEDVVNLKKEGIISVEEARQFIEENVGVELADLAPELPTSPDNQKAELRKVQMEILKKAQEVLSHS